MSSSAQTVGPVTLHHAGGTNGRFYHAGWLVAALGVLAVALVLEVQDESQVRVRGLGITLPEACQWRRWTGVNCPGCGLTRSMISLAHGDWQRAWRFNPAGFGFFALLVAQIPFRGLQLWRLSRGRAQWHVRGLPVVVVLLAAAMLTQWLVRFAG